jgi:hypothetical protein
MLKWIAQNKYKIMAFIIGLYLLVDVVQHKGQARVLFPKDFSEFNGDTLLPLNKSIPVVSDKHWKKGVNTKEALSDLNKNDAGFECDVYFDSATKSFDVHHDPDKNKGYGLNDLLQLYQQKNLKAGIWLDVKNLDELNERLVLESLIELRNKYNLQNKMLVESGRADLLTKFSDSNFFTAYYIPFFNPYKISSQEIHLWADSISSTINKSKISALSGYYFQYPFLTHYFPQYPVLTWVDTTPFSLVNFLFQKKIDAEKSIFIVLKP